MSQSHDWNNVDTVQQRQTLLFHIMQYMYEDEEVINVYNSTMLNLFEN